MWWRVYRCAGSFPAQYSTLSIPFATASTQQAVLYSPLKHILSVKTAARSIDDIVAGGMDGCVVGGIWTGGHGRGDVLSRHFRSIICIPLALQRRFASPRRQTCLDIRDAVTSRFLGQTFSLQRSQVAGVAALCLLYLYGDTALCSAPVFPQPPL